MPTQTGPVKDYNTLPPIVTEVREYRGNPEGLVKARPGTIIVNSVSFAIYVKKSTEDLATGWHAFTTSAA